jgi:heme A synthase
LTAPLGLRRLSFATLVSAVAVIVWGALVRASKSGAGCGDQWPMCGDELVPHLLTTAKLIELTHRLTTGALGVLTIVQFLWARRARIASPAIWLAARANVVFLILESLLGAVLVKFGLVVYDASPARTVVVALHLTNTMLLLGAQTLTWWWARGGSVPDRRESLSIAPLVGVLVVAIAGAIVALGDTLFPATSLLEGLRADLSPTAHFLVKLRAIHPAIAVLVALWIASTARADAEDHPSLRPVARVLVTALAGQLLLGVATLLLLAPLPLQLAHLALADVTWIALVIFVVERSALKNQRS